MVPSSLQAQTFAGQPITFTTGNLVSYPAYFGDKRQFFLKINSFVGLNPSVESIDPQFGSYFVSCTGQQVATYPMDQSIFGAMTFMFWFRLRGVGDDTQTLVAFQDSSSSTWDFAIEYNEPTSSIKIVQQNPAFADSTTNLQLAQGKINIRISLE